MKIYLGLDAQGERIKMKWTGSFSELAECTPDTLWYSVLDETDEDTDNIAAKAATLGITVEVYNALQALGASD